jgi:hypothetical protein
MASGAPLCHIGRKKNSSQHTCAPGDSVYRGSVWLRRVTENQKREVHLDALNIALLQSTQSYS